MKDDKLYLIHISECIAHIEQYVSEGREKFMFGRLFSATYQNSNTTLKPCCRKYRNKGRAASGMGVPWGRSCHVYI